MVRAPGCLVRSKRAKEELTHSCLGYPCSREQLFPIGISDVATLLDPICGLNLFPSRQLQYHFQALEIKLGVGNSI